MSVDEHALDAYTPEEAGAFRDLITFGKLCDVLARLRQPGGAAYRAEAHRMLAQVYQELAVLDAIALTNPPQRDAVVAAGNDMVRLLNATAEAEAARGQQRQRRKSPWTALEEVAGDVLDAIAAACEGDHRALAQAYRQLREQLALHQVTPRHALSLLRTIEVGCRTSSRRPFVIADGGPRPEHTPQPSR